MTPEFGMCTQAAFGNRGLLTPEQIAQLRPAGIECVEIGGPNTMCFDYGSDAYAETIAQAVRDAGLRVWSFHGPFCPIAMDDPDVRKEAIDLLIRGGRVAALLGAGRMVLHPGRDVPSENLAREVGWCREAIARALDEIPAGVALAVESCSAPYLGMRRADLLEVITGFDPARVGICLDTGHWNKAGHVMESAPEIAARVQTVHLHDGRGPEDDHRMPGDGTIDWPVLLHTLRDGGYRGPWMLEAGPRGRPLGEHFAEYSQRMRAFLQ